MSMSECIMQFPGQRLGVVGFLTEWARKKYQEVSNLEFGYLWQEQTRAIMAGDLATVDCAALRAALWVDIQNLRDQQSWINTLAIATPGLDIIAMEEVAATGLKLVSMVAAVTAHCKALGVKQVGLLGTELDMAEDGPLALSLKAQGIQTWRPREPAMRQRLSQYTVSALGASGIYHNGAPEAIEHCMEIFDHMLFEAAGFMDAVVICNPELRPLMPHIQRLKRSRASFVAAHIIDATGLYWHELAENANIARSKNPPDQ